VEPWWRQADESPHAFRDPASVASLIEGVVTGVAKERERAVGALARVVKALEDEPVEESLQLLIARLPDLAAGLTDPTIEGEIISVMRRVRPDRATVDRLLALLRETLPERRVLVVAALGLCANEAWTEHVERAVVEQLGHAPCRDAAADALYGAAWQNRLALPETLHGLAKVAIGGVWPARDHAALSLGLLLTGEHARLAVRLLDEVLASGSEGARVKVAEVCGWRKTAHGDALLDRCLADPSALVRAAAEASAARRG
jgi:hypothetical protein